MSAAYEHILYVVQNDVAHIILNRPEKLNAIGDQTREEIGRALTAASEDTDPGRRSGILRGRRSWWIGRSRRDAGG
jgi:enoyl-CoA hydratase/carnithine racemase